MEMMEQTKSQKKNNAVKTQGKNLIGSVMVLGSGIAGMQSALDLANSGYYVYFVRKIYSYRWTHVPTRQDLSHQ